MQAKKKILLILYGVFMWSHIFLFGSLPRRRPPEFTAILMFEFWREATAASVPGLLCQSGRRRPENVSILSSLVS